MCPFAVFGLAKAKAGVNASSKAMEVFTLITILRYFYKTREARLRIQTRAAATPKVRQPLIPQTWAILRQYRPEIRVSSVKLFARC